MPGSVISRWRAPTFLQWVLPPLFVDASNICGMLPPPSHVVLCLASNPPSIVFLTLSAYTLPQFATLGVATVLLYQTIGVIRPIWSKGAKRKGGDQLYAWHITGQGDKGRKDKSHRSGQKRKRSPHPSGGKKWKSLPISGDTKEATRTKYTECECPSARLRQLRPFPRVCARSMY